MAEIIPVFYNNIANLDEESFIKGNPEAVYTAVEEPKILITWPHGHETLGPRVGYQIYSKHPELIPHVDYICGNPAAAAAAGGSVRYIEKDLNRSFGSSINKSYEGKRAQAILKQIDTVSYSYILDLHTTSAGNDSFFLANRRNQIIDIIIAASNLSKVVLLPDEIARDSLIGQVNNATSIEYPRTLADDGVEETISLIHNLVFGTPVLSAREREFYYVHHRIDKANDPGHEAQNFEICKEGYYPVLLGANSYRRDSNVSYLGFAATSKEIALL